jgi:hypothetical protein
MCCCILCVLPPLRALLQQQQQQQQQAQQPRQGWVLSTAFTLSAPTISLKSESLCAPPTHSEQTQP